MTTDHSHRPAVEFRARVAAADPVEGVLLDLAALDEAHAKGYELPWALSGNDADDCQVKDAGNTSAAWTVLPDDAALIVAAVNALPRLTAAVRAALALADELDAYTTRRGRPAPGSYDYGVNLAQADAANLIRSAVTAALTGGGQDQ